MKDYRKVGVMGGMGPDASARFYQAVVRLFQQERGARYNFEFPEMLIHNVPSPDNVEGRVGSALLPYMLGSVRLLKDAGMDFIAIPCNSAHVHIDEVVEKSEIPILNILEETARVVVGAGLSRILILGTRSTLEGGLYQTYLEQYGIKSIIPDEDEKEKLTQIIMSVNDGTAASSANLELRSIIANHPDAEGVVLGCTELPLIKGLDIIPLPVFDSLAILARATFEKCVRLTPEKRA